ncbi:unnamed protein product [Diatraea saccharalis]|uniref:Uncharacterized protein n=1 Tax=Diatraea saccharalis TaxID=40085 RepID=A0A9N9R6L5_9NEOP|nr:unnamed protein product [Diatraea saccharalis]
MPSQHCVESVEVTCVVWRRSVRTSQHCVESVEVTCVVWWRSVAECADITALYRECRGHLCRVVAECGGVCGHHSTVSRVSRSPVSCGGGVWRSVRTSQHCVESVEVTCVVWWRSVAECADITALCRECRGHLCRVVAECGGVCGHHSTVSRVSRSPVSCGGGVWRSVRTSQHCVESVEVTCVVWWRSVAECADITALCPECRGHLCRVVAECGGVCGHHSTVSRVSRSPVSCGGGVWRSVRTSQHCVQSVVTARCRVSRSPVSCGGGVWRSVRTSQHCVQSVEVTCVVWWRSVAECADITALCPECRGHLCRVVAECGGVCGHHSTVSRVSRSPVSCGGGVWRSVRTSQHCVQSVEVTCVVWWRSVAECADITALCPECRGHLCRVVAECGGVCGHHSTVSRVSRSPVSCGGGVWRSVRTSQHCVQSVEVTCVVWWRSVAECADITALCPECRGSARGRGRAGTTATAPPASPRRQSLCRSTANTLSRIYITKHKYAA